MLLPHMLLRSTFCSQSYLYWKHRSTDQSCVKALTETTVFRELSLPQPRQFPSSPGFPPTPLPFAASWRPLTCRINTIEEINEGTVQLLSFVHISANKGLLIYHESVPLFSVSVSLLFLQHQPTPARDVSRTDGCCGTVQQMLSIERTGA